MNTLHKTFLIAIATGLPLMQDSLHAQTLILDYDFNQIAGGGTTAPSTGSTTTSLNLYDSAGSLTNLHGAAGSGVSGAAGDLALNNSASTGMGSGGTGGRAQSASISAINSLQSFTLAGWFKTGSTTSISSNAFLINNQSGTSDGFRLYSNSSGYLALNVNGAAVTSSGAATYAATEAWVFFAVTYDGTLSSNNVKFYVGNTSTGVSLNVTRTLAQGMASANSGGFALANVVNSNIRPFDGYLDNIAVYGSQTDNSGVLSLAQLEAVRAANLVPEPAHLAFLGCGAGLLAMIGRWKRGRQPAASPQEPQFCL
ncbi:MAG: hypothetical protein BGO12_17320 [Verrucomicrobia bacterium 61-8]|nr:LamG domain-containing protein [Verrucomicrobiota bacterium]OJV24383.1 MAG: hypothetical protein BGO12_17320 [Verrucomicrobia bacterium 61-8]